LYATTVLTLIVIATGARTTFGQNTFPTPSGNVGVGTTSPATLLNVNLGAGDSTYGTGAVRVGGTNNYASLELGIKGPYDGMISTYGNDLHLYAGNWRCNGCSASENHKMWFYTSQSGSSNWNTAKMVLDSTGYLGLGTSSPNSILELQSPTPLLTFNVSTINSFAGLNFFGAGYGTNTLASSKFNGNSGEFRHEAGFTSYGGFHTFFTNGTERLRIDSAGGVGIGVSPSGNYKFEVAGLGAPGTGAKIGTAMIARSGGDYDSVGYNFRPTATSGLYKYDGADTSSRLEFASGGFKFKTAGTGSPDNTISYADAVTILQNGLVGIGTTSPSFLLDVRGPVRTTDQFTSDVSGGGFYQSVAAAGMWGQPNYLRLTNWSDVNKGINIQVSTGNVGIGTPGPVERLEVNGNLKLSGTGNITAAGTIDAAGGLKINGSPITSSQWTTVSGNISYTNGNVGIGTPNPAAGLEVLGSTYSLPASSGTAQTGLITRFRDSRTSGDVVLDLGSAAGTGPGAMWLQSTDMRGLNASYNLLLNPNGGNVGIGIPAPAERLEVSGNLKLSGTGNVTAAGTIDAVGGLKINGSPVTSSQWSTGSGNINYTSGQVGIGTDSPAFLLDVRGPVRTTNQFTSDLSGGGFYQSVAAAGMWGQPDYLRLTNWSDVSKGINIQVSTGNVGVGTPGPTERLEVNGNLTLSGTGNITAAGTIDAIGGLKINGSPITTSQWTTSGSAISYVAGNVGIGVTNPSKPLTVQASNGANAIAINGRSDDYGYLEFFRNDGTTVSGAIYSKTDRVTITDANNTDVLTVKAGSVGIGIAPPSPSNKLHVQGDGKFTGNLTVDGNISAKYQDVAEWVPSSEQLAAGTVVVLDSTKSNQVTSSSVSYDTRVAGVISEQPGITLGEKSDSKVLVATTGRVKVKVDASKGAIHIGDLLVTSDIPGVAMKSEAVSLGGVQFHRPGTLIGKALEPLEKGKGEILVLLSLQ
jgi:hypothetical protein